MTSPGTIKSIQKRFYTVVTASSTNPASRVRSNSASRSLYTSPSPPSTSSLPLSFFDSPPPPPPSSRPGNPHVISTSRLPGKGDAGSGEHQNGPQQQPPFSLALTSPHPNSSSSQPHSPPGSYYPPGYPFFPYSNPFALVPFYNAHTEAEKERERLGAEKKQRTRLQLDVGAYGIAKRGGKAKLWEQQNSDDADDLGLAVQVGEDAYFVRDNAMGVADGVGGWARMKHGGAYPPPLPILTHY
jgi:hypothetical protein